MKTIQIKNVFSTSTLVRFRLVLKISCGATHARLHRRMRRGGGGGLCPPKEIANVSNSGEIWAIFGQNRAIFGQIGQDLFWLSKHVVWCNLYRGSCTPTQIHTISGARAKNAAAPPPLPDFPSVNIRAKKQAIFGQDHSVFGQRFLRAGAGRRRKKEKENLRAKSLTPPPPPEKKLFPFAYCSQ